MTTYEAAEKWGTNTGTICKWIKRGRVKAKRIETENGQKRWLIPDDHPCPRIQKNGTPGEVKQKATLYKGGKRKFIAKYAGTFSTKYMALILETTPAEVRAIYDDIVAKGGF